MQSVLYKTHTTPFFSVVFHYNMSKERHNQRTTRDSCE
jgi:hypothetical protein